MPKIVKFPSIYYRFVLFIVFFIFLLSIKLLGEEFKQLIFLITHSAFIKHS